MTFFSGVYGTCIGAINKFGTEEKSLIGLSGIFIGIGEILGLFKKFFCIKSFCYRYNGNFKYISLLCPWISISLLIFIHMGMSGFSFIITVLKLSYTTFAK